MSDTYQRLDMTNWSRRQHYQFYQDFSQPYFSIGCDLNAAALYNHCKAQHISFFDAYLFMTMQAINTVEPLRYRLVDEQIRVYQSISISVAVMAADQTFRFCEVPYSADFTTFQRQLKQAKATAINGPFFSDTFFTHQSNQATVYMSVIPWISFTSFAHARHGGTSTGIPLLAIGKMRQTDNTLPITVDAHHALVDGVHVGQFIEVLQGLFDGVEEV
ncbi:MAG: chloramphenicol O-acetyltransferase type A [Alteromonadaceae bacterium]|jgi:chloramphenicol O-acetyltransferase type A